nr:MAG TPA: protein of unknown function (DUF5412) [Caudoviricetes sp.]
MPKKILPFILIVVFFVIVLLSKSVYIVFNFNF